MSISRENFAVAISICSLVVSVIIMLWGNNLFGKLTVKVTSVEEKTKNIEQQFDQIIAISSSAPVTESRHPSVASKSMTQHIDIHAFNITLSDLPSQEAIVQEQLQNPDSGYPALVEAIQLVMNNHRLRGNAVPLTIINARNLAAHRRPTNQPFTSSYDINADNLKGAIYQSWRIKNPSSTLGSFQEIVY